PCSGRPAEVVALAPRRLKKKTEGGAGRLPGPMTSPQPEPRSTAGPHGAKPGARERPVRAAGGYAATAARVGLATGVGALTRIDHPDLVMLYLLVVVFLAARFGRGPSLVA